MTRLWRALLAVAMAAAVAACARSEGPAVLNVCWDDHAPLAKGADWSKARLVDVAMVRGGEFDPSFIKLKLEEPHVLRIANTDTRPHLFRAPALFRAVAVDRVAVGATEYPERCLSAVTVPAKSVAEIRLVPVRQGSFEIDDGPLLVTLWFPFERNFGFVVVN